MFLSSCLPVLLTWLTSSGSCLSVLHITFLSACVCPFLIARSYQSVPFSLFYHFTSFPSFCSIPPVFTRSSSPVPVIPFPCLFSYFLIFLFALSCQPVPVSPFLLVRSPFSVRKFSSLSVPVIPFPSLFSFSARPFLSVCSPFSVRKSSCLPVSAYPFPSFCFPIFPSSRLVVPLYPFPSIRSPLFLSSYFPFSPISFFPSPPPPVPLIQRTHQ